VFLTNVNLTIGEKDDLIISQKMEGFKSCEVRTESAFELHSIRLMDSQFASNTSTFHFQSQSKPVFAKWGDDINSIISTGFQKLDQKLDRILFCKK